MSEKYKIRDQSKLYFVTFATMAWVDALSRWYYKDIFLESIRYCQKEKGLEVYAWCIMSNHVHLILRSSGQRKPQDIIRDFKKYTSVHICKAIEENQQESRKEWMLWIFKRIAAKSNKHKKYAFWQNNYHPIELTGNKVMEQKLNYIHQNPVEERIVYRPEDYIYSSAGGKGLLDVTMIE
ncbi:transposase [Reichenbachiella sp. MALMAid0571]|uniref:REP-associated tyrosine transposase n=1 Tax=Reichenbachiella sp. MALMAid0571 TaxID=3143939 RepID=UPI0032DE3A20